MFIHKKKKTLMQIENFLIKALQSLVLLNEATSKTLFVLNRRMEVLLWAILLFTIQCRFVLEIFEIVSRWLAGDVSVLCFCWVWQIENLRLNFGMNKDLNGSVGGEEFEGTESLSLINLLDLMTSRLWNFNIVISRVSSFN